MEQQNLKYADINWVDLGPNVNGSVQAGLRPCICVSNSRGLRYSEIAVVIPLTTAKKGRNLPTHLSIPASMGLGRDSVVLAEQLICVERKKVREHITNIANRPQLIEALNKCIKISLNMVEGYA